MSATHTNPAPTALTADRARRTSLLRWITAGVIVAAIITVVTIAVWPAVDDLTSQADHFRTQGPEVQQAFWDGVQEGLPAG